MTTMMIATIAARMNRTQRGVSETFSLEELVSFGFIWLTLILKSVDGCSFVRLPTHFFLDEVAISVPIKSRLPS